MALDEAVAVAVTVAVVQVLWLQVYQPEEPKSEFFFCLDFFFPVAGFDFAETKFDNFKEKILASFCSYDYKLGFGAGVPNWPHLNKAYWTSRWDVYTLQPMILKGFQAVICPYLCSILERENSWNELGSIFLQTTALISIAQFEFLGSKCTQMNLMIESYR